MLLFARPRQLQPEPVDVARLIGMTTELLRRDPALAGVTVHDRGGQAADRGRRASSCSSSFHNVLMNAAQAMGGQGVIDVAIGPSTDRCACRSRTHGPGMPPEVREKAFEPFFTTKHRGTGPRPADRAADRRRPRRRDDHRRATVGRHDHLDRSADDALAGGGSLRRSAGLGARVSEHRAHGGGVRVGGIGSEQRLPRGRGRARNRGGRSPGRRRD